MDDRWRFGHLSEDDVERMQAMERDLTGKYGREIVLIAYEKADSYPLPVGSGYEEGSWMEAGELGRPDVVPEMGSGPERAPGAPGAGADEGVAYPFDTENVRDIWNREALLLEKQSREE